VPKCSIIGMEYYDIVNSEKVHCATQVCVKTYFVIAKFGEI
jgi:hypothetical protein